MSKPLPGDQASATVTVAVEPLRAFEIFTRDIDRWWKRGPRFRNAPGERGFIRIEPGVGGRVFESFDGAAGETVVEVGRIEVWEPPSRLVMQWRNSNFAPLEKTEVEVRFEPAFYAAKPACRVTVVHRGWSAIRADHPARHGAPPPEFLRAIGLWWGEQMGSLRTQCARQDPNQNS